MSRPRYRVQKVLLGTLLISLLNLTCDKAFSQGTTISVPQAAVSGSIGIMGAVGTTLLDGKMIGRSPFIQSILPETASLNLPKTNIGSPVRIAEQSPKIMPDTAVAPKLQLGHSHAGKVQITATPQLTSMGKSAASLANGRRAPRMAAESVHADAAAMFGEKTIEVINEITVVVVPQAVEMNFHDFSIGERVITDDGVAGKIVGFYNNGDVSLDLNNDAGYYRKSAGSLARTSGHAYGFSIGERIITNAGVAGKIVGFYNNGDVSLDLNNDAGYYRKSANSLARTSGHAYGFSIGERVITNDGVAGKIVGFYNNGDVSLDLNNDAGYYRKSANSLASI